jgi:tetratricopeptide (TPR) repeat protein
MATTEPTAPIGGYSARQVAALLDLSVAQVRAYVRAGFLKPTRGPRRELRFSFQDLVLLKTAKGLIDASVSPRRVRRALRRLKEALPAGRPLAAVHITAEADRLIVRDGATRFEPESGQVVLDFDVEGLADKVAPLTRKAVQAAASGPDHSASEWFHFGGELEVTDTSEARRAYEQAIAADPAHGGAHVNLGRLLHAEGDLRSAEALYRRALELHPDDATAAFNLGVALEDLGRPREAADAYEHAVATDARYADAHYNLARLYERLGEQSLAIRHLAAYRRLTRR